MTPYYSDDSVTIYHGDALELVRDWDGEAADAIVTDPPYSSGATMTARRDKRAAMTPESVTERPTIQMDAMGLLGYEWVTRQWFLASRKITKPGGHLLCFTDWRMQPWVQTMLEAAGWKLTNLLVWDKGYAGLGSGFRAQHEMAVVGSNGEPVWHSYESGNVLQAVRITKSNHPHEKPVSILQPMIRTVSPVGGLILDPFMGSGSTLVAAKAEGRRAVGMEIDERHCETAALRCSQDVLGLSA